MQIRILDRAQAKSDAIAAHGQGAEDQTPGFKTGPEYYADLHLAAVAVEEATVALADRPNYATAQATLADAWVAYALAFNAIYDFH